MHFCSDAQKPRSVKTAPAVLTYRKSCINATDSKCRRAIKPKAQKLSPLSASSRGDDILNRSRSACDEGTCVNASRELQAQSKPSRFNRDSDFAAPPVLVYRPKGSVGEGSVSFAGQLPQVHRKAVGKMRGGMTPGSFKIPHLLSEPRYEIMLTDLNRKVGIFEKRGKFSALSDGKQFSSLMILTMTEKVLSIFSRSCKTHRDRYSL